MFTQEGKCNAQTNASAAKGLIFICVLHMSGSYHAFMQKHTQPLSHRLNNTKSKQTRRACWNPWLGRDWKTEICETGLLKPRALKAESPHFDVWIYYSSHSRILGIYCLRQSKRHVIECWQCIIPPFPFMFLMRRSSKALRLSSIFSRSLPAYFSVSACTQPGY